MKRRSIGAFIFSIVLALIYGLTQPFTLAFSLVAVTTPIIICVLYAWCGVIPAALCAISSLASLGFLWGSGMLWGASAALILPAIVALYLLRTRRPYFRSMQIMTGVQLLSLLSIALFIYLRSGVHLVDLFMEQMEGWLNTLPAELSDMLLAQFSLYRLVDISVYEQFQAGVALTAELRQTAIAQLVDGLNYTFKLSMPSLLMTSSLLTGVLTIAWPTHICVRRGDEPAYPYVALNDWFLPARHTTGMLAALITGLVLLYTGVSGADAAATAVTSVIYMLFSLQGLASMTRSLKARGWSRGKRTVLLVLLVLFVPNLLRFVGIASALFGRKGAISGWLIRKRKEHDQNKED